MTSDLDYRAIRKRVEAGIAQEKFRKRMSFLAASLFCFVIFMIIAWGIFLSSGQHDQILVAPMILLSFSGLMGLLAQAVGLSLDTKGGEDRIRDQLLSQEINREMLRMGLDDVEEHEKRKGMMRLTDDGELEEVADDVAGLSESLPLKQQR